MSFCTDAQIKTSVAAALHVASASLESFWTDVITDANAAAYSQIVSRFLALGYTVTQINQWDQGATYQKFLARYQALIDGSGDKERVGEWRTELDYWRGKLEEVSQLEVSNELEEPTASDSARIGYGDLRTTSDLFRLDPDDVRRGESTVW